MARNNASFLAVMVIATAVAGCRTAPIMNVVDSSLGASLPAEEVAAAIERAGATLGWTIVEEGPGRMVGTLRLRKHVAVVSITYDARSFSIRYRDSTNLLHSGDAIHRNYNSWVQNLAKHIREEALARS